MKSNLMIKVEVNKSDDSEYLVKDINNITIGRFNIVEMNDSNKRCDIRLRFYKENNYILLKETLKTILNAVLKNINIFKINIRVYENIDINAFLDLGFTLEGILSQNDYNKGEYLDELSLGITRMEYNQNFKYSCIELEGKNIILRNLTPANSKELLDYYIKNKKHLESFEPTRDSDFYTLDNQRSILNESYRQFLKGTNIDLGIFKDEKLIGKIKLSNIVYGVFKNGILGYSIDKDEQGKGYMKEAVKLFLNYAFNECELHRIEASVLLDNERSKGVLSSCGFELLGINKKYLLINGKWRDHGTYYILKDDFYKTKSI